jgi:hypothetical protein
MHVLCGELVTDEEFAKSSIDSVEIEINALKEIVRRMKAGENVDALLETVLPILADLERLHLQRDALLAARDGAMH